MCISEQHSQTGIESREQIGKLHVYDIDALITNIDNYTVSHAGSGSRALVFRLQNSPYHEDMTLKLFFAENQKTYKELSAFARASGHSNKPRDFRYFSFLSPDYPDQEFIQSQIEGHVNGNAVMPDYIDSPVCIWARRTSWGESETVGYSLPFISGDAIKIASDPALCDIADELEASYGIYVGNRGSKTNESKNAIVNGSTKKFIDVRIA